MTKSHRTTRRPAAAHPSASVPVSAGRAPEGGTVSDQEVSGTRDAEGAPDSGAVAPASEVAPSVSAHVQPFSAGTEAQAADAVASAGADGGVGFTDPGEATDVPGGEADASVSANGAADAGANVSDDAAIELAQADAGDVLYADADEDLDSEDSLTFSNGVIEKIVAIAVRDVPGVLGMKGGFINRVQETFGATDPTKGVSVEVMPDNSVRVNISVLIEYGAYAPQVFEDVKKAVVKQVGGMTGLVVGGVNLRIEDVLTPEEYENARTGRARLGDGADTAQEA